MLSGTNQNFDPVWKPNIHARTEAYHTYALASSHRIANGFPADNPPRDPSGDLLEYNFPWSVDT